MLKPGAPTGLVAIKGNANVSLSWTVPTDNGGNALTDYKIYRDGSLLTTISATSTTYVDTGLTNGVNYVYTVAAVNINGEGAQSTSANATPSTTPGTPTGLSATKGNANVSLSWTAPTVTGGSPLTNYTIYRDGSFLVTISAASTTYVDTGLTNGVNYVYTVSTVNANGESSESISANATPSTTPGTPTDLIATKGNANVSLSWTAPVDTGGSALTDFKIYRNGSLLTTISA
ncbi:MAG: fibronectin type III domain-containing protein, partial [Candidatus Kariarchaeaceae archaeon]